MFLTVMIRRSPRGFLPMILFVFSNLKTWLTGIHHYVNAKHLQAYPNEYQFHFYPFNAFRSRLGIASDAVAPTSSELFMGKWQHTICGI